MFNSIDFSLPPSPRLCPHFAPYIENPAAAHDRMTRAWDIVMNSLLGYTDKTIFKMAAIRHLEVLKMANFVTLPVPEHDYASTYQISR